MIINHNIAALNTHRQMGSAQSAQMESMEKLSSGLRINSAKDDAAGLTISEKMRGQIRGLEQGTRNAQDGISMIQTAEGALSETQDILQRMRELSVQSANDTNTGDDRKEINKEIEQLKEEINRISETTEFNGQKVLNGSLGAVGTSSTPANLDVTSVTGLKTGDYSVNVTTAATKASAAAGATAMTGDVSAKELTINGTKIDFSGMTNATQATVLAKINEYTDVTGVTATASGSDAVKLDQTSFGSNEKIVLGGAQAAQFGGAVTAGVDAVATVLDDDGVSQQVAGVGQDVNYRGAEFVAKQAGISTVTVTSSGSSLQVGANKDQNILIDINEMSTNTLGGAGKLVKDLDLRTTSGSNDAIKVLDDAIKQVSGERSKMGAFQNRLEHTINNLGTTSENLTAAESRIRDVDYTEAA